MTPQPAGVSQWRVVVDTNVLVRGLVNPQSVAGRVVHACDRRAVVLLLSKPVLGEYRAVLAEPAITARYPELTPRKVELALRRLRYVGDVIDPVRANFEFPRDPRDAMLLELAIDGNATHLVSGDRDSLSLPKGRGDASKRFRQRLPGTEIIDPADFLARLVRAGMH